MASSLLTIQNPLAHGFVITQTENTQMDNGYTRYVFTISHPDVTYGTTIDRFEVTNDPADAGKIIVADAFNADLDRRPKEAKLNLRGLILGFGKHMKQNPRNLRQIYYKTVVEDH